MAGMGAYGEDLAYVHDAGFSWFATSVSPVLLKLLRRHGITSGLVVDLGCGSGIWANELTGAGYDVIGVDISPDFVNLARAKAPKARFAVSSLLDYEIPRCSAVTALGECLNYLFDPKAGRRALAKLFKRIHRSLEPGGLLIFDIAEPGQRPVERFVTGEDWVVIVKPVEDPNGTVLTRSISTFRKQKGDLYRRSDEVHRLALYWASEVRQDLESAGFEVRVFKGYGTVKLPPAHSAIIAKKPATLTR
jgi:SAM-dependent methyltransferase